MTRVVVTGAAGRMGTQIVRLLAGADGLVLHAAVERPGGPQGDSGLAAGLAPNGVAIGHDLAAALPGADVVVDFTSHEASARHAEICGDRGVPLVIGSTGFTPEARARVERAALRIPVVLSPNMSVGVNVLFELVRRAAVILGDAFDVEVVELHHRKKKDAPSGTAERLGEVAAVALGRGKEVLAYQRHGLVGERPAGQIGMQALRGGDVVGEHTVYFCGEGERLELTHRATSREQFARGALRAARWIVGKPAGMHELADVLGLPRASARPEAGA
jgi:4-hydroxy-tetrahydrodipicolinate reductase